MYSKAREKKENFSSKVIQINIASKFDIYKAFVHPK